MPRSRLEQRAHAERLSLRDFQEKFAAIARKHGEGDSAHVSERSIKRWMAGSAPVPRSHTVRVLERWFGEPIERLLGPPDMATPCVELTQEELIVSAGRESVEHAIAAASTLDPSALEHLAAAANRAAHAYYVTPPMRMLGELVRLRDTIYQQLDRTHKPRQQAELYLLAGQVCGLLSSVCWDLGNPAVAEEQARAAHSYGSVIDHPSLCAWARALQVTVAFWSGQPRQAIRIATSALPDAPPGTARVRLHSVHARALAMVGARQEVRSELDAANGELDLAGDDPFLDDIGGELAFDRSRRALCAGTAYVALGDGQQAETEAINALELFEQTPREQRWSAGDSGARIDLAAARVLNDNLAGARAALHPVFALDPEHRTEALTGRLHTLGRMLGATRYRAAVDAVTIAERIEDFTAHRAARVSTTSLPPGH